MTPIEAMKKALEILEAVSYPAPIGTLAAIKGLRQAIKQMEADAVPACRELSDDELDSVAHEFNQWEIVKGQPQKVRTAMFRQFARAILKAARDGRS